jgi:DNA-binding NtrC family response regulator
MTRRMWLAAIATAFAGRAALARAASFIRAASMQRAAPLPPWRVAEIRYLHRSIILRTLFFFDYDMTRTADYFGSSRRTLANRMRKLGMNPRLIDAPPGSIDIRVEWLDSLRRKFEES